MLNMLHTVDVQYLGKLQFQGRSLEYGSCYMCHRAYQIPPGAVPYSSPYAFPRRLPRPQFVGAATPPAPCCRQAARGDTSPRRFGACGNRIGRP